MDDTKEISFYEAVGGEETFRRLTHLFYQGVAADPTAEYPLGEPLRGGVRYSACNRE